MVITMKNIIIVLLLIILFIVIFYLVLLKRSLKKFANDLERKVSDKSNVLLTCGVGDKDLVRVIERVNSVLDDNTRIRNDYENKNESLQKMITNVSHDLRTPLTSALGYIDIILRSDLADDDKERYLKVIEERLKRLSVLVNSFFEFSKIISNDEKIVVSKVNLVNVLEKSISNYYEDFSKEDRVIQLNFDKRNIVIDSNELMLSRIFDNLIGNAFKHSTGDLIINVRIKSQLIIEFINDLIYDDLDVNQIFDEFYTVDISRTKGNTGLGLAISKEFVEELGGTIRAEKDNGKLKITITF